jgi:hypothetical protein
MVMELMHHARKVPSIPLSRTFSVAELAAARVELDPPPSWVAIFMRAWALAARKHPDLRRALIPWPWKHLYEHPQSEAAVLIERDWEGEKVVLGAKVRAPEDATLQEITQHLRYFKEAPVLEVSPFRQILRLGRLPWFIRRFAFWQTLYLSGYKRAKRFGTFMISSHGSQSVEQEHPITALTTFLTFGPISEGGDVVVRVIYDHNVMDGRTICRAFHELDRVLHGQILAELQALRARAA